MAVSDPFVPLRDWRANLFRGDHSSIDRCLAEVEAKLPTGWIRDLGYEQTQTRPDRIRCYVFDQAQDAAVRVWLQRVTGTRLRGGPVQVLRHASVGNGARIAEIVSDFANSCVLPAARAAGVRCTRPKFGHRSSISPATETLFTRLADTAEGAWPLEGAAQELWDELVANCLEEQAAIDRDELSQWLSDSGWEPSAAPKIADQFYRDSEWLAKRLGAAAS